MFDNSKINLCSYYKVNLPIIKSNFYLKDSYEDFLHTSKLEN